MSAKSFEKKNKLTNYGGENMTLKCFTDNNDELLREFFLFDFESTMKLVPDNAQFFNALKVECVHINAFLIKQSHLFTLYFLTFF